MKISSLLLVVILFFSCKKVNKIENKNYKQKLEIVDAKKECSFDSIKMKISEYKGINFYSENTMRGKGVIQISVENEIQILNLDKTKYGNISLSKNDLDSYDIDLPKNTIAREVIPDSEFRIFDFDAEQPNKDSDFIIIYLNKEQRLISKKNLKYTFLNWNNYIKSAFIQIDSNTTNLSEQEKKYWYKVIKINTDSMLIKSISKTDCDYVEEYQDVSKWIKWKNGDCKLIKLNFCY